MAFVPQLSAKIQLSDEAALAIGKRIWQNECAGTVEGLTSWNRGEAFASLGIGHFIWYPEGQRGPFEESFPRLVEHLQRRGVRVPDFITRARGCPWRTREEFLAASGSPEMRALRSMLEATIPQQAEFVVMRLEAALPKMLAATREKARVEAQFYRVAETSTGIYALVDYVNFKGEGTASTERYRGQGWGLLQVLEGMDPQGVPAVVEFARSADRVLTRRVANAPPERNEGRWLPGWRNRLKTYSR